MFCAVPPGEQHHLLFSVGLWFDASLKLFFKNQNLVLPAAGFAIIYFNLMGVIKHFTFLP